MPKSCKNDVPHLFLNTLIFPTKMDDNCLMCDIYEKDLEPRIYENDHFYAIFDVFPVTPGHALVIPKRHVVSRFDLTAGVISIKCKHLLIHMFNGV